MLRVGGIDGVLRLLDQHTEKVLSSSVMDDIALLPHQHNQFTIITPIKIKSKGMKEKRYKIQQKLAAPPEFLKLFDPHHLFCCWNEKGFHYTQQQLHQTMGIRLAMKNWKITCIYVHI